MPGESDQTRWVGTRKVDPAIADLQAVKDNYAYVRSALNQDCTVSYSAACLAVPADEIYVVTNVAIYNQTSFCDMQIFANIDGVLRALKSFYSIPTNISMEWSGLIPLREGEAIWGQWLLGGATDDVKLIPSGYKIGVY